MTIILGELSVETAKHQVLATQDTGGGSGERASGGGEHGNRETCELGDAKMGFKDSQMEKKEDNKVGKEAMSGEAMSGVTEISKQHRMEKISELTEMSREVHDIEARDSEERCVSQAFADLIVGGRVLFRFLPRDEREHIYAALRYNRENRVLL